VVEHVAVTVSCTAVADSPKKSIVCSLTSVGRNRLQCTALRLEFCVNNLSHGAVTVLQGFTFTF
jgi:hypothetical protein